MRSGKLYWPNTLLKSLARPARQAPQRSPFTQNMSRSLLRLAACAGLFVSLCLPSVVHSQAASAPADDVVMKELVAQNGGGGVIAMDRKGNIATPFNTPGMYRAWVTSDGKITVKIYKD